MTTQSVSEQLLEEIRDRLDVIAQLLVSPVLSLEPPVKGKTQRAVLELCDLTHTREEISQELGISLNNVDVTLNALRAKRVIKSIQIGGKTYYVRVK
jgi:Fic family protein